MGQTTPLCVSVGARDYRQLSGLGPLGIARSPLKRTINKLRRIGSCTHKLGCIVAVDWEDRGRDFVTPRGLEVVSLDVYVSSHRYLAEQLGRFASFLTGAHVSELLQNRLNGTMAARALRASSHAIRRQ
jgi:hypothetical protein